MSVREIEGIEAQKRFNIFLKEGQLHFANTGFVQPRPFTETDRRLSLSFLVNTAPYADHKIHQGYWASVVLSSIYGSKLVRGVGIPDLLSEEAAAMMPLGDLGKEISPRYLRGELVGQVLMAKMGFRKELLSKYPPIPQILGLRKPIIRSLNDMTPAQAILDFADNAGKLNPDGSLFDINTTIFGAAARNQQYSGGLWPSEDRGKRALSEEGKQDLAIQLLKQEVEWLSQSYGIDFADLRERVVAEFQSPFYQEFLLAVKDAQQTLNPEVDQKLGRIGIRAVVFGVGELLLVGPDNRALEEVFVERIAYEMERSVGGVENALAAYSERGLKGQITEEDYLVAVWNFLEKDRPIKLEDLRKPFIHPWIYQPTPEMPEIVKRLAANGINIYVLTDVIETLTPVATAKVRQFYPAIFDDHKLVSNREGCYKRDGSAFGNMHTRFPNLDTTTTLFVDDKEDYTYFYMGKYGGRGFHFRGNPYKGQSAQQRLKLEFIQAQLAE